MNTVYRLKIELAGSEPKIWRRITLPSNTVFEHLHDIIQISMGWNDEYLFEFKIGETRVLDFGPAIDTGDDPLERDSMDTQLDELVTMVHTKFTYIYHLEDRCELQCTLEEIISSAEIAYPVCLDGEGSCPSDVKELWPDEDPNPFDREGVNIDLRRYSEEWEDIYEEDEDDDGESHDNEPAYDSYEALEHLRTPSDLLNDEQAKQVMDEIIDLALTDSTSVEYNTYSRLVKLGQSEEKKQGPDPRSLLYRIFL